jgi:regulator of protease activity HflC (stomatin/prohibitin superfamily)
MSPTELILSFLGVLLTIFVLSVVFGSFFTVETAQVAIVQRLGKFSRVAGPGLNWKTPLIEAVVQRMSMKVQQFDVKVETKTQDNVFVQIPVSIQYKVIPESVEAAFYKLTDPVKQIESMVYNVVLGHVPKMKLDDTFLNQAAIANDLRDSLDGSMKEYGYSIVKVLISDIVPDQKVKTAMNDINAAQREREATVSRAETNKLLLVKQAEAEAESKRLQGEGIANQRKAIIIGGRLRENRRRFHPPGRHATRPNDPVLRHSKGNRRQRSQQHHLDPAHAKHVDRSIWPDPQRRNHRRGNDQASSTLLTVPERATKMSKVPAAPN